MQIKHFINLKTQETGNMKVDFNKQFVGPKGNTLKDNIADTIASYMFNLANLGGNPINREQKMQAYRIYRKVLENPAMVDITTEDASFIKDVCAEYMTAGAYGQIEDLIENN